MEGDKIQETLRRQFQYEARRQRPSQLVVEPPKSRPYWVPEETVNACMRCGDKFTLYRGRCHCHSCGKIFDKKCCHMTLTLPNLSYNDPVEVCPNCFILYCNIYDMKSVDPQWNKLNKVPSRPTQEINGSNCECSDDNPK